MATETIIPDQSFELVPNNPPKDWILLGGVKNCKIFGRFIIEVDQDPAHVLILDGVYDRLRHPVISTLSHMCDPILLDNLEKYSNQKFENFQRIDIIDANDRNQQLAIYGHPNYSLKTLKGELLFRYCSTDGRDGKLKMYAWFALNKSELPIFDSPEEHLKYAKKHDYSELKVFGPERPPSHQ